MTDRDLAWWLRHIEQVHPMTIEMGLDRVRAVADRLQISPNCPVITVAGTNGKGSACAMLEAILSDAGFRTGCYTSPHILRYTERIRIGREEADPAGVADALARVEAARGDTALTYFEFSTLAAMLVFADLGAEVVILEVGLGGRLDAVNAFDADCSMVMTVDMDHMDYLGDTREAIGYEKAGIYRRGRPAICADPDPPSTLLEHANAIGARLLRVGVDFGYSAEPTQWRYWGPRGSRHGLPYPALRGAFQLGNASACMAALDALHERLPMPMSAVRSGLLNVTLAGRFQVLPGRPLVILDVAHNPQSAGVLADNLRRLPPGRVLAVFGMLKDKDIEAVVSRVKPLVSHWFVAPLGGARGADAGRLESVLREEMIHGRLTMESDVEHAYETACKGASETDKIIVFGSFHTVAAVMALREHEGSI